MDLKDLYDDGFIAGPNENEEAFFSRVKRVKELFNNPEMLIEKFNIEKFEKISNSFLCFRSSRKMPFWFAGMTLVCDFGNNMRVPLLQLPFRQKFSWINEVDIIEHEKVHALRVCFDEPQFEEILAYRKSKSLWRRFFGPFFQKSTDSYIFLFSIFVILLIPFLPMRLTLLAYTPSTLLFTMFFLRLIKNQWLFKLALKRISKQYSEGEKLITLLTDKEIKLFALKQENSINMQNIRWKQILDVFSN